MSIQKIPRTYPNTNARPHRGDKVLVKNNRGETVTCRVESSEVKQYNPRGHFLHFRSVGCGKPNCKEIQDVELKEASTPRFDDYEPENE